MENTLIPLSNIKAGETKKLLLAKPWSMQQVYSDHARAWEFLLIHTLINSKKFRNVEIFPYYECGIQKNGSQVKGVAELRNRIVKHGMKTGMDYICMCDADMIFPANMIVDCFIPHMLAGHHAVSIVHYKRGDGMILYTTEKVADGKFKFDINAPLDTVTNDVILLPSGGFCVSTECYSETGCDDWFQTDREDLFFTDRLLEKGYKIYMDTRFHSKHIGVCQWGQSSFETERERYMEYEKEKNKLRLSSKKTFENLLK